MPSATSNETNSTAVVGTGSDGALSPGGIYNLNFPIQLAAMTTAAADLMTNMVLGHRGKILAIGFTTTTLGTGTSASQVLNLEIGTTNLTGGVVTVLLADTDTLGKRVSGTAITALNEFTATDTLSIEVAASGTVFTAGAGFLTVRIQNLDF